MSAAYPSSITLRSTDDPRWLLDPRAAYPFLQSAVLAGDSFRWEHLEILLASCPNLAHLTIENFTTTSRPYDLRLPESAALELDRLTIIADAGASVAPLWKLPYVREIETIEIRLRRAVPLIPYAVQEGVDFVLTALPELAAAEICIVDGTLEVHARSQKATDEGRTNYDMLRRFQLYDTQLTSPDVVANIHAVVAERAACALAERDFNDLKDQRNPPLSTAHEGLRIPLSFVPAVARVATEGAVVFGGGLVALDIEWDVPVHVVAQQLVDFVVPTQCAILEKVHIFKKTGRVVLPAEMLVAILNMREWNSKLEFLELRGVVLSSHAELPRLARYCQRIIVADN